MKKNIIVIAVAIAVASIVSAKDKDRAPAQQWPPPSNNGNSNSTFPSSPGATGGDEVVSAGTKVTNVMCLTNGASPVYSLGTGYSTNIRVTRVSATGDIRYEVYKDNRFLASCMAIQVQSSP